MVSRQAIFDGLVVSISFENVLSARVPGACESAQFSHRVSPDHPDKTALVVHLGGAVRVDAVEIELSPLQARLLRDFLTFAFPGAPS